MDEIGVEDGGEDLDCDGAVAWGWEGTGFNGDGVVLVEVESFH